MGAGNVRHAQLRFLPDLRAVELGGALVRYTPSHAAGAGDSRHPRDRAEYPEACLAAQLRRRRALGSPRVIVLHPTLSGARDAVGVVIAVMVDGSAVWGNFMSRVSQRVCERRPAQARQAVAFARR